MRPRIRTIKPEFFQHEDLFDAERETGLPLRIAYAGLWCYADREGRFKWRPRTLCLGILPYDGHDFSRVLDALTTRGWVVHYASDGAEYGWLPSFIAHQVINNRERDSQIPDYGASTCTLIGSTREPRVRDACVYPLEPAQAEGKGREGKGTEGNPPEGGLSRWALTAEVLRGQFGVKSDGLLDQCFSILPDGLADDDCARNLPEVAKGILTGRLACAAMAKAHTTAGTTKTGGYVHHEPPQDPQCAGCGGIGAPEGHWAEYQTAPMCNPCFGAFDRKRGADAETKGSE